MWYVILALCILFALTIWLLVGTRESYDKAENRVLGSLLIWLIGGAVLLVISYPTLRLTTGFWEGYSEGERDGYVTKFSRRGALFKTWEGQLQVGTGAQAALQEPWAFSVPDDLAGEARAALGTHVRISYTQFLMMPWRLGETEYLITKIEPIQ